MFSILLKDYFKLYRNADKINVPSILTLKSIREVTGFN